MERNTDSHKPAVYKYLGELSLTRGTDFVTTSRLEVAAVAV